MEHLITSEEKKSMKIGGSINKSIFDLSKTKERMNVFKVKI